MLRPSLQISKSVEYNLGVLITFGGINPFGWQTNTLTIYLLFFEISVGLHFKGRY